MVPYNLVVWFSEVASNQISNKMMLATKLHKNILIGQKFEKKLFKSLNFGFFQCRHLVKNTVTSSYFSHLSGQICDFNVLCSH